MKVPTEKEIEDIEKRLLVMKAQREEAKQEVVKTLRSDDILSFMGRDELLSLMRRIQSKLRGTHRKVRGSPVPEDLKADIVAALKQNDFTLSQLEGMFGVSISYLSRIKKDLKKKGLVEQHEPVIVKGPVMNAYTDHQLVHS